jgi:hypothetical protein
VDNTGDGTVMGRYIRRVETGFSRVFSAS